MLQKIAQYIAKSRPVLSMMKNPVSPWLVLLADLSVVFVSTFMVVGLIADPTSSVPGLLFTIPVKVVYVCAIYAVVMLFVKSFRSIVRLSAFEDTYRVFSLVVVSSLVLAVLETALSWTGTDRYIGLWNIFIIGVMSFALMITIRLVVKYAYLSTSPNAKSRERVIMFGSTIASFTMASSLRTEENGQYMPVAMLSLSGGHTNREVNGIPVLPYSPDTVAEVFKHYNAGTLLFLSSQIEFIRHEAADVFLSNNIKLMMLNQIEEFDVGTSNLSHHVKNIKIDDLLGRAPIDTHNPAVSESLHGQTVLITGAAGSIGSEIVRQVARFGAGRIVLVDQAETPMHDLQLEMEHSFPDILVELCIADVTNEPRMSSIFAKYKPRIVYHAAAYKHVPMMEHNPTEAIMTNVFGTKIMADLSVRHKVDRFVMISTDKAVNPTNIMGASKRIAEIYVQSLAYNLKFNYDGTNTRFITTRFGNVLGSNGSVIPLFRKQIADGGPVTITHRDIVRYFMTIPEACSLVLEAGCMGKGGEIFIFDMGKPVKIYDLATRMISLSGLRPDVDIKIVETGLRPGEKLYEELLNDKEKTIATHHSKIMIAKVRTYDYNEVLMRLQVLRRLLEKNNIHDLVSEMKIIVPEYKSNNSEWQAIDAELSRINKYPVVASQN